MPNKKHTHSIYALILAGGTGTRLWPRSRRNCPKQLLPLISQRTMLQETVDRILPIIPAERIFIATNEDFAPMVRAQLPMLPRANIIREPSGRGTAPCIGLGGLYI
ncbi:MAG: sugar phosphate nucleotidyltransferase, partial [Anaerolineae bacterium]|nr:sugar phosphate nucleotidyltransferase [Anaerolineae bacterium]